MSNSHALKLKPVSGHPHRRLTPRAGRTKLRGVLKEMHRWTERLQTDLIADIDDDEMRFAIAFILDAICDTEDDCGHLRMSMTEDHEVKLDEIVIDEDLQTALIERCGETRVIAAADWLSAWMRDARIRNQRLPLHWLGWRLGNLRIPDASKGENLRIEINHVVVDFKSGRTLGITLWDGENLFSSTILPFPLWSEKEK